MRIRTLKEQYECKDRILKERLDIILPQVMFNSEADMWIVASKEYHEDPVFKAMVPANYLTARRITMFVFVKVDDYIHRYSLSMPDEGLDQFYEQYWHFGKEEQMMALKRLLKKYNPNKIAINVSKNFAVCDGLSMGLYTMFMQELDDKWLNRMINDDLLGLKFMELRTPTEMEKMPEVCAVAHEIIESMYTKEVIQPGVTTTDDLVWFMKEEVNKRGLEYWFEPTMDLQREGNPNTRLEHVIIEKGDLLHCDFGIRYMNMCTDTQRLAYVPKDGETQLPDYLVKGMKAANRFQDIVRENMIPGRTGNEVFTLSKKQAKEEGITNCLYSHPTNLYGHGPGPTIGLFSKQEEIPVQGDVELSLNTCFALELNVTVDDIVYYVEETIGITESGANFWYKDRDVITFIK